MSEKNNDGWVRNLSLTHWGVLTCLGTGLYTGMTHAFGEDPNLIIPVASIGLEAFLVRNEANPKRENPEVQKLGKKKAMELGACIGVVANGIGYLMGYSLGYLSK